MDQERIDVSRLHRDYHVFYFGSFDVEHVDDKKKQKLSSTIGRRMREV